MQSLYQTIAASGCCPGVQLTPGSVQSVWEAVSGLAEEVFLQRGSVVIPGICHFLTQEEHHGSGTWNVRRTFVPQVVLAPSFVSTFHVSSPIPVAQAHVGSGAVVQLNLVQVHEKSNGAVPRHCVGDIVKAVARVWGTSAKHGSASLQMGFVFLQLQQGILVVRWNKNFINQFEMVYGVDRNTLHAVLRSAHEKPSAGAGAGGSLSPRRPQTAATTTATSTSCVVPRPPQLQPPKQPATDRVVTPRSLAKQQGGGDGERPPSWDTHQHPPLPLDLAVLTSSPRKLNTPSTSAISPVKASASSPSSAATKTALPQVPPRDVPMSPFHRQKLHKLHLRRQRKKAYVESWSAAEQCHANEVERSREEGRREAESLTQGARSAVEQLRQNRELSREEAKHVQGANLTSAQTHRSHLLPPYEPLGTIFYNRPVSPRIAIADVATLQEQLADKASRTQQEREQDKALSARLYSDAKAFEVEQAEKKKKRVVDTQTFCRGNDTLVSIRQSRAADDKNKDSSLIAANSNPFAESEDSMYLKRQKQLSVASEQRFCIDKYTQEKTIAFRKANDARKSDAVELAKFIDRTCLLHQYEQSQKALRNAQNNVAWAAQMQERNRRQEEARVADLKNKPQTVFINESSDDDEDDNESATPASSSRPQNSLPASPRILVR